MNTKYPASNIEQPMFYEPANAVRANAGSTPPEGGTPNQKMP
jgi:hypothetical protein